MLELKSRILDQPQRYIGINVHGLNEQDAEMKELRGGCFTAMSIAGLSLKMVSVDYSC